MGVLTNAIYYTSRPNIKNLLYTGGTCVKLPHPCVCVLSFRFVSKFYVVFMSEYFSTPIRVVFSTFSVVFCDQLFHQCNPVNILDTNFQVDVVDILNYIDTLSFFPQ